MSRRVFVWAAVLVLMGWAASQFAAGTNRAQRLGSETASVAADVTLVDAAVLSPFLGYLPPDDHQDQLHERAVRYCRNTSRSGAITECVDAVENGVHRAVSSRRPQVRTGDGDHAQPYLP
jgi:hypothetical protein